MMLNELLEKINQEMFDQIEQLKLKKEYSEESKRFSDEYRKKLFCKCIIYLKTVI